VRTLCQVGRRERRDDRPDGRQARRPPHGIAITDQAAATAIRWVAIDGAGSNSGGDSGSPVLPRSPRRRRRPTSGARRAKARLRRASADTSVAGFQVTVRRHDVRRATWKPGAFQVRVTGSVAEHPRRARDRQPDGHAYRHRARGNSNTGGFTLSPGGRGHGGEGRSLREGAAPATNPRTVYVISSGGGVAGPITGRTATARPRPSTHDRRPVATGGPPRVFTQLPRCADAIFTALGHVLPRSRIRASWQRRQAQASRAVECGTWAHRSPRRRRPSGHKSRRAAGSPERVHTRRGVPVACFVPQIDSTNTRVRPLRRDLCAGRFANH